MKEIKSISEFKKLAFAEAKKLKKYITQEEKELLRTRQINPIGAYDCIYGNLTGHCSSDRAVELIKLCASKVFIPEVDPEHTTTLNGSPKKLIRGNYHTPFYYYSPIEVYIAKVKEYQDIQELVNFITE